MTKPVFSEQSLAHLYKYFDVEKANDPIFVDLYNSLSDWLVAINENRDCIATYIISSGKAQNFIVSNHVEKKFSLVWDVSFWHFYTDFLLIFFSYDSLRNDVFLDSETKDRLLFNTESFFKNSILNFLSGRFLKNAAATNLFYELKNRHIVRPEFYTEVSIIQIINSIVAISKEFVLLHELEHILFHLSPEIYNKDTKVFDDVLRYYRDVLVDKIDENITHIPSDKFKDIVDKVLRDKDKNQYSELYSDFHAFFELLIHHGENFDDTNCRFSQNIPDYLFSIKLLKIFESCINYITNVVESVISTSFQNKNQRIRRVETTALEYQKTIFNRDYLSVEIFAVALMLCAQDFPLDQKKFAESIDTIPFVLPYTEKMQPTFNRIVQDLANRLMMEVG